MIASPLVTVTTAGFTLHRRNGEMVAYAEHLEQALAESRANDAVVCIRRVSDGEVMAFKPSMKRRLSVEDHTLRVAS